MADWTSLPDALFDVGKPARGVDAMALRDNPIAMFEGAPGAPRLMPGALQRLSAGDTLRANVAGVDAGSKAQIGFIQHGSVRIKLVQAGSGGGSVILFVRRFRGGVPASLQQWNPVGSPTNRTIDVNITAGDIIEIEASGTLGASNVTVNTAGEFLIPALGLSMIEPVGYTYA